MNKLHLYKMLQTSIEEFDKFTDKINNERDRMNEYAKSTDVVDKTITDDIIKSHELEFEHGVLYGFIKALSYVLQQPEQPLKSNTIGTKRKPRRND